MQACVTQHVTVMGLNDTFWLVTVGAAICILLALFVGRDPAVEAAKRAQANGEAVEARQLALVSE